MTPKEKDQNSILASKNCEVLLKEIYEQIKLFKTRYYMIDETDYVRQSLSEIYHEAISNPNDNLNPDQRGDSFIIIQQIPNLLDEIDEISTSLFLFFEKKSN